MDVKHARVPCADDGRVVEDLHGSIEPTAGTAHVLWTANDKSKSKRLFFDSLELHFDVVTRQRFTEFNGSILVVNENLFYTHRGLVRKHNQVLALSDGSCLQLTHHTSTHFLVLVCNWKSERQIKESLGRLELIKKFEKRRSIIPWANLCVHSIFQVGTSEARNRHKEDICLGIEPCLLEERLQDVTDLFVSSFIPDSAFQTDRWIVHFVDCDDQSFDTSSLRKYSMLTRLPTTVETCFEFSFPHRDDKNSNICLSSTSDHVWNEVLVTGSIENCIVLCFRFKGTSATLLSLSFCPLFIGRVHAPCKFPALSVFGLGLSLILFHGSFINLS
mmetsp:Transcript_9070/g.20798  ORF Transcript_9070/g.20798 Transcript_9070/m.20798 type:complete len:331 (-) Transcript_9070:514-1506(-)